MSGGNRRIGLDDLHVRARGKYDIIFNLGELIVFREDEAPVRAILSFAGPPVDPRAEQVLDDGLRKLARLGR